MHKLNSAQLATLGAPSKGGAQQIEDWLRALLRGGTLRLEAGVFELRGGDPVVTTLGELKKACGVAVETIKQGLRPLEMDHWILLVDGAHTRLLGPPRFRVSVTKENVWGSVGQAIELGVTEGLNPLESIDYDQLRQKRNVADRKQTLALGRVSVGWSARVRLANGRQASLNDADTFTLAAGSQVREEAGRAAVLPLDLTVKFAGGRDAQCAQRSELTIENDQPLELPSKSVLHLEGSSIIRLAGGQTGLLEIAPQVVLDGREIVDWGGDSSWLGRFRNGTPLVLLRRAIFVTLHLQNSVVHLCHNPQTTLQARLPQPARTTGTPLIGVKLIGVCDGFKRVS